MEYVRTQTQKTNPPRPRRQGNAQVSEKDMARGRLMRLLNSKRNSKVPWWNFKPINQASPKLLLGTEMVLYWGKTWAECLKELRVLSPPALSAFWPPPQREVCYTSPGVQERLKVCRYTHCVLYRCMTVDLSHCFWVRPLETAWSTPGRHIWMYLLDVSGSSTAWCIKAKKP